MLHKIVNGIQIFAVGAAVVTVLLLFAPASNSGGGDSASDGPADPGAVVYSDNCASCHGADGGGGVGPALSGGLVVDAYPDIADEIAIIAEGRAAMPSFGDRLTPEELTAVAEYTRESL
jgi:mono/diheme cytochrome c family protein